MRRVTVYWWSGSNRIRIGELAQGRGTPIVYEWDTKFISSPTELSPIRFKKQLGLIECPAQPFEGLPGLFADHVPDGWGRILLRQGLGRIGIDFDEMSPLDMLQYIGDRSMGALSFEPSLRYNEKWADGQIDLDALERGVGPILSGTPSDVLEEFLAGGASPNGIRPKIIAKEAGNKLFVGSDGMEAPEWLIKFRAPDDSLDIGKVEYIYSLMAKDAGVNVSETKLFKTHKGLFFGTKRFDRKDGDRLHMHTLSGILNVSPANFSVGYDHFAKVAIALTKDIRSAEQVFKIAVFNIFACNQDDHSRNVSFLMDPEGSWQVAPAYDLTFHRTRFDEHKMGLFQKGKPNVEDLKRFGVELGLSQTKIKNILERTKESLIRFHSHAKTLDLSKKEMEKIEAALPKALVKKK